MNTMIKRINILSILILLIFAVIFLSPAAAENTDDTDMFLPPEYGIISVSPEIDNANPNEEIGKKFFGSYAYQLVFGCLRNHNDTSKISPEILSTILKDFEYHTSDGKTVVKDISIEEVLRGMKTEFKMTTFYNSYINCEIGSPAWKTDLKNAYNFIQIIALMNGFDDKIPLRFVTLKIIPCDDWNDGIFKLPKENESKIIQDTKEKTDRFRPIIGGIISTTELIPIPNSNPESYMSTLSLSVKFSSGKYGIISCGHGHPEGTIIYQPTRSSLTDVIGSVTKRYLNGIDASLITCNNGIKSKGSINGQTWNPGGEIININSYGNYDASKNFRFSGVSSGNVNGLIMYGDGPVTCTGNSMPCDPQGPTINNALILQGRAYPGDSGSPVYQNYDGILPNWNNKLVGILSGGASIIDQNGNHIDIIIVQSIMPILNQLQNDGYSISILLNGNS